MDKNRTRPDEFLHVDKPEVISRFCDGEMDEDEQRALFYEMLSSDRAGETFAAALEAHHRNSQPVKLPQSIASTAWNHPWLKSVVALAATACLMVIVFSGFIPGEGKESTAVATLVDSARNGEDRQVIQMARQLPVDELSQRDRANAQAYVNLSVQRLRGERTQVSFANPRNLVDGFGIGIDGYAALRSESHQPTEIDREDWLELLDVFPESDSLRLNFVDFLLRRGHEEDIDEAKTQLEMLRDGSELRKETQIALGMTSFQAGEFAAALQIFQQISIDSPEDLTTLMHIGVTLERLDRPTEALAHWEHVVTLVEDVELQQRIERRIDVLRTGI